MHVCHSGCWFSSDGVPSDAIRDGKLSSLQLETILLAGQRHLLLQDGVRAGFFLGDGTVSRDLE